MAPELISLVKALAAFAVVTGLALGLRYLAFHALHRWANKTTTRMDGTLVESLRLPSLIWCVLIGLYVATDIASLPERLGAHALHIIFALLVLSVTAALANVVGSTLQDALRKSSVAIPATGLSLTFAKVAIWVLGGLVLLSGLGVSITPILTALGVGGLAVALALQDTLSNFFAGIHLLIDKPIRVGDFVRLETGQESYIMDIGWRTTRIRTLANNMVIVPNNKVTQAILINYSLPEQYMGISIPINIAYSSNADQVVRMLVEEATKAVGLVPGLLAKPEPTARLIPGFGDNALAFTLNVHVEKFEDQYAVQDELRRRILKRLAADKIGIPIPQLTTHLRP